MAKKLNGRKGEMKKNDKIIFVRCVLDHQCPKRRQKVHGQKGIITIFIFRSNNKLQNKEPFGHSSSRICLELGLNVNDFRLTTELRDALLRWFRWRLPPIDWWWLKYVCLMSLNDSLWLILSLYLSSMISALALRSSVSIMSWCRSEISSFRCNGAFAVMTIAILKKL